MIKISNVDTCGISAAIRGMRNPMNSWDRSDSGFQCKQRPDDICKDDCTVDNYCYNPNPKYKIGEKDFELMKKLAVGGSTHAKYRRMMVVYVDISAPLYWWKEFDTYKVGTVANSCSTMHKVTDKEFDIYDFSCEYLDKAEMMVLDGIVNVLNQERDSYLKTKDKKFWWHIIQLLPLSYNQKRTIMLNYEVLHRIYFDRRDHKLDEWRNFCKWVEGLEYSELITCEGK